jgi:hypothetical protein
MVKKIKKNLHKRNRFAFAKTFLTIPVGIF